MNKVLKLLLFANSFFVFAINLFAPVYAVFVQTITDNIAHVGSIWGTYIILSGILVYFISKYENKMKYADHFLIAGFVFRMLGWLGYFFATSIVHIYLVQILLALGEAFGSPTYGFLFSSHLDKGFYASEFGVQHSIFALVSGVGAILGAMIVEHYGFDLLFLIMIGFSLISTVIALRYKNQIIDETDLKKGKAKS